MAKITVSVDKNADLKALRKLEASGLVELFAVDIEGFEDTKKVKKKELPIAVIDSPFGLIGRSVIAADDNKYQAIQQIVGKQNHGDCLHLERHISSGRDLFVTDDNDFLSCREELDKVLGIIVLSVTELIQCFADGSAAGDGVL